MNTDPGSHPGHTQEVHFMESWAPTQTKFREPNPDLKELTILVIKINEIFQQRDVQAGRKHRVGNESAQVQRCAAERLAWRTRCWENA